MEFKPVDMAAKSEIGPFLRAFGQNSCQHALATFVLLQHKYGDSYAIVDDCLFVLRAGLCRPHMRVYLAPFCRPELREHALALLLADAHAHNAVAAFVTLTAEAKEFVVRAASDDVLVCDNLRDNAEYLYALESLANLPGTKYRKIRQKVREFRDTYGERAFVARVRASEAAPRCTPVLSSLPEPSLPALTKEDVLRDVRVFQQTWYAKRAGAMLDNATGTAADSASAMCAGVAGECAAEEDAADLHNENAGILCALDNFDALGLSLVAVYVERELAGFAFGSELSDTCIDEIAEKGNQDYRGIHQVLVQEFAKLCLEDGPANTDPANTVCSPILLNREEDLGHMGLRDSKMRYYPVMLMEKWRVIVK